MAHGFKYMRPGATRPEGPLCPTEDAARTEALRQQVLKGPGNNRHSKWERMSADQKALLWASMARAGWRVTVA